MIELSGFTQAERFLHFFSEISKVPRGSGNTAGIAGYLMKFAEERGLEAVRDRADNVIIRKCATPGYESRPTVIFQSHTDMVAEKEQNISIDMSRDSVQIYRDGDFLRARGTTLGADDGIGVAYALALLDSTDIQHPALEAVFTSDEEIGLLGAAALDASSLHGRIMINIDSDEEGVFTVGCAGGVRVDISLPIKRSAWGIRAYEIKLTGLRGGHSGIEINKSRANAIKVLAEIISSIPGSRLVSISGGHADNAIPRDASAVFVTGEQLSNTETAAAERKMRSLCESDDDAVLSITTTPSCRLPLSEESSRAVLSLIREEPNGVIGMSEDIEGLVETSLNVGIVRSSISELSLTVSIRSSSHSKKSELLDKVTAIAKSYGASVSTKGDYPAWEYRRDSHLRDVMCSVYEKMYGAQPRVVTIHAGLECGIFADKIDGLDCVSIGPDNLDIHTTAEHLSIPSSIRVWEFLIEVLKKI